MTTYLWTIQQMERLTSDGFVTVVHYNVSGTEDEFSANIYGAINYAQTSSETYIPYADLTQDIVAGWVQEVLGKEAVETSLQSQIDALKTPMQKSGLPWA